MKSVKGTRTEKNLLMMFSGESQARNRYDYFAKQAKKEGYEQIADVFTITANQEKTHAKKLFEYLEGGDITISGKYPAGIIGTTLDNLREAIAGEQEEYNNLYPECAKVADEEGFSEIADLFRHIAEAEQGHATRYRALYQRLQDGTIFEQPEKVRWQCRNCGYIHEGKKAPKECPSCKHPQAFFEIENQNYYSNDNIKE